MLYALTSRKQTMNKKLVRNNYENNYKNVTKKIPKTKSKKIYGK